LITSALNGTYFHKGLMDSPLQDFNITPRTVILLSILLIRAPQLPSHLQKLRLSTAVSILASATFTKNPDPLAAKELHRLLRGSTGSDSRSTPQQGSVAAFVSSMIAPARAAELPGILRQIATEDGDIEAAKLYAQAILSSPSQSSQAIATGFLESILPKLERAVAEADKSKPTPESPMFDLSTTPGKKGLGEIFTLLAQSLGPREHSKRVMYLSKAAGLFQNPGAYWELALMCRPEPGERHKRFSDLVPGYPAELDEEIVEREIEEPVEVKKTAKMVGKLTPVEIVTDGVSRKFKAVKTPEIEKTEKVKEKDEKADEGTVRATAYIRNLIKAAALGKKEAAGRIAGYYIGIGMDKEAGEWAGLALKAGVPIIDVEGKEVSLDGINVVR
jgi:hypothetical protein